MSSHRRGPNDVRSDSEPESPAQSPEPVADNRDALVRKTSADVHQLFDSPYTRPGGNRERLKLEMSLAEAVHAMSGGNAGALTACLELMKEGPNVDPDALFGGLAQLMALDSLGIWESRIYMLWNDVCHRDTGTVIALLRANQLGQLAGVTREALNHAIENRGRGLDIDAAVAAVKERLPNFNVPVKKNREVEEE